MKILLGSLTYPLPNGVTNSINLTLDGFTAAGHELLIVAPDYGTGHVRKEHRPVASSRISQLVSKPLGNSELFFSIKAAPQIQNLIESFQPDAYWLHTVTWAPNIFEVLMQRSGRPNVLTYHTMIDYYGRVYAGQIGETHMANRSRDVAEAMDHVIVPSTYIEKRLRGWGVTKPVSVIPTGVRPIEENYTSETVKKKYRIPAQHKILLSVGRLVREKNIAGLFAALKEILKTRTDVTLLLVGPGNLKEFRKEAEALGVGRHVVMTDQVELAEARKFYGAADLFVFASQNETQGLVFGEAMSAGLPIVALDSPIRSQFYPEEVAVVAKDESSLAAGVINLLDDDARCQQLRQAGQTFFEANLSVETMIERQLGVFNSLGGRS